jgi:cell volume regulation protein A
MQQAAENFPQALDLIDIKADSALNQVILLFGASYILFDGGASLRFNVLKQSGSPSS